MDKKEEDFRTMAYSILLNPKEPKAQELMLEFVEQYHPDIKINITSTGLGIVKDF